MTSLPERSIFQILHTSISLKDILSRGKLQLLDQKLKSLSPRSNEYHTIWATLTIRSLNFLVKIPINIPTKRVKWSWHDILPSAVQSKIRKKKKKKREGEGLDTPPPPTEGRHPSSNNETRSIVIVKGSTALYCGGRLNCRVTRPLVAITRAV